MLPTRRLLYTTLAISGGSRALKPPTTRVRAMSALATTNTVSNKDGAYVRHAAKHRTDAVEAEAGRYHLHVALAPGGPGGPALRLGLPRPRRRAALQPSRPRL